MARTLTFIDAINEALHQEMEHDERVCILGEDLGLGGGVFKATAGLYQKFGEERVLDSPLAEGIIIAAPTPMLALAAMSMLTDPEKAAQADPAVNAISPAWNTRLRPTRSARLPMTSNRPAKTMTYASTIHCNWLSVARRSRTSVGRATFRTVLSRLTISSATQRTASASQRRGNDALSVPGAGVGRVRVITVPVHRRPPERARAGRPDQ